MNRRESNPASMTPGRILRTATLGLLASLLIVNSSRAGGRELPADERVTIVESGTARLPILVGSVREPAEELGRSVKQMTGAELELAEAKRGARGIYVGLAADFPWLEVEDAAGLGAEGFVLRCRDGSVHVLAYEPSGVEHGVATLLRRLGCRWFFPGKVWEVVPRAKTLSLAWEERRVPSFPTQRRIWYGYGAYAQGRADWEDWNRHNRLGGGLPISIGHTWHGLNPEKEFDEHPEWFAEVDGKRQPSKPCYSHPAVIERGIEAALRQAEGGTKMISMTPPDGLGYCECERCRKVFQGGAPFESHRSLFARRPDGTLVNITSETVFGFINRVAAAVAKEHPGTYIGCYAYSAYSHPPSFKLHPNVYLQTTTAYRRTPLSLDEQIAEFGEKTEQVGVREYYSVWQWDWDYPDPGKVAPHRLKEDLTFFHDRGVTAVNAESSNNWAPRGLGYYVAAQLLWDVDQEVEPLVHDFYTAAFGPAADVMQRYYVRWYGPEVAVLDTGAAMPEKQVLHAKGHHDPEVLKAAYSDLDEALRLVRDLPEYRDRIDHLRMYLHYLFLRKQLEEAEAAKDPQRILDAIRAETVFGGRLTNTHMIHTRPLIGKAFLRRFRRHEELLAQVPEENIASWRKIGNPLDHEEMNRLWAQDKAALGVK